MDYESTLELARESDLRVYENYDLTDTRLKGLYCDGRVALSCDLSTSAEKKCVLMEEIGHHNTSHGNILDLHNELAIKQEHRARIWAYERTVTLSGIINAYKKGCRNRYEIAEKMNVTENFFSDAISYYKSKYGIYVSLDNYIVYFEPLGVLELYS